MMIYQAFGLSLDRVLKLPRADYVHILSLILKSEDG